MIPKSILFPKRPAFLLLCLLLLAGLLPPVTNAVTVPAPDSSAPDELWLSQEDHGRQVSLAQDQSLVLALDAQPATGYGWQVVGTQAQAGAILRQAEEVRFEAESRRPDDRPLLGAAGKQILRFRATAAGRATLQLVYRRPWETRSPPARTYTVQVLAAGPSPSESPASRSSLAVRSNPGLSPAPAAGDPPPLGLPASFDWCDQGACTPVKDQGNCGSCWAFGTVGPLESNIKRMDGFTRDLSEQYLLSCNVDGWSCRGGWWAHDYHKSDAGGGAVYEEDFPYVAWEASCGPPYTHHETIIDWAYVGTDDDVPSISAIKQAIYDHGPVSVAICVGSAFEAYDGGIFQTDESSTCGDGEINHAVVLVGWDDGQSTWRLRNSWGPGWGDGGYMDIRYGTSNVGYSANYVVYGGGDCRDPYEVDDDHTSAGSILANGAVQTHNFHTTGDADWVRFSVMGGCPYTLTTSNLDAGNDTVLTLYDTDGTTELASNDDCPGGSPASCIVDWTAPVTGTYYARVDHPSGSGDCSGYGYGLSIASDAGWGIANAYLPLVTRGVGCADTQIVQNTGFESGPAGWVQASGVYDIVGSIWYGYYPYTGSWSAWFAGYDYADDRLYQTIQVPAGASSAELVLYLYVETEDSLYVPYDEFHVELQDSTGTTLESFLWADNTMASTDWYVGTKTWTDFSAHAGQTRRLAFQGTNDESLITNFFVDDVTLWSYCDGAAAPGGGGPAAGGSWQPVSAPLP